MFRSLLRRTLEYAVVESGLTARRRRKDRERIAVLSYHNVVPSEGLPEGDLSLHLPLDKFRNQLDFLREHFELIALEKIGEREPTQKPLAAVTFDDAYRGCLELALPELAERQIPATIFVCPGLLEEPGFWWDRLAGTDGAVSEHVRDDALSRLKGQQREVLSAHPSEPIRNPWLLPGSREDLARAIEQPGVTLASHTWSHPNLAALDEPALERELLECREWLTKEFPDHTLPDHLAFPYGLYDSRIREVAFGLGYRRLYRVEGGRAKAEQPPSAVLPRLNVPRGASLRGFDRRVSGFLS